MAAPKLSVTLWKRQRSFINGDQWGQHGALITIVAILTVEPKGSNIHFVDLTTSMRSTLQICLCLAESCAKQSTLKVVSVTLT